MLSLDFLDDCGGDVTLHNVGLYTDDTRCIAFLHERSDFFHFHTDTRSAGCAIDLYCGGIGGWTQAASSLGYQVIAGIDNDFDAIQMYSKMHKADIAVLEDLPSDARHVALFADVSPRAIANVSMKRNVGMWMVSTPCPDWSLAAHQRGLSGPGGFEFLIVAQAASVARPQLILCENVSGFPMHADYELVNQAFALAGYRLLWSQVLPLKDQRPIQRIRWLGIFQRKDIQARVDVRDVSWVKRWNRSPERADVFPITLPVKHHADLFMDESLREIYDKMEYHPEGMKKSARRPRSPEASPS